MTAVMESSNIAPSVQLNVLELEITGGCQLTCSHCLSESSPQGTHGTMATRDWREVIADATVLEIQNIQLIGGEPTLHPNWVDLVDLALRLDRKVEVYSNLFHVRQEWWDVLSREGVSLATSYYSDDPDEHDRITTRPGSHTRTRAHIKEAQRRNIPLRVGIVEVLEGQRTQGARDELASLGITEVRTDRVRAVGRAATSPVLPSVDELCGRCGHGRAAVMPNGDLTLCVMSRFMPCGNVKETRLADIVGSPAWNQAVARVPARAQDPCDPDCQPLLDSGDSAPAEKEACDPAYEDL
jgi:MoaA/NifB/PqqE/SkfB family radical SAM enzyme